MYFFLFRNTLESISSKQNELLSCRCTCSKAVNTIQQTKDSEDDSNLLSTNNKSKDSADDYVNPDDINIIVPTSVTHLGSVNILQEQKTHDDRNPNHIRDSSQLITDDSHTEDNKVGQLWRIVKTSVDND